MNNIKKNIISTVSNEELKIISSMHISASLKKRTKYPLSKYHFFLDKVKLFYTFDSKSILVTKNKSKEITGLLIYSFDEKKFNKFVGPSHINFYIRIIKTITGYYGFDFVKYLKVLRSSLGGGTHIEDNKSHPNEQYAKIWVLLVADECRKQGIATTLLQKCISATKKRGIKNLRVTVKDDNIPALKAYEKLNFKKIGTCEESSGHSFIMELKNS